jgi:hypothetical protein
LEVPQLPIHGLCGAVCAGNLNPAAPNPYRPVCIQKKWSDFFYQNKQLYYIFLKYNRQVLVATAFRR